MRVRFGFVIGALLLSFVVTTVPIAQQIYQPDDPVPAGAVFRIVDLEFRTSALEFRTTDLELRTADLAFRTGEYSTLPTPAEGGAVGGAKANGKPSGPHSTMSSNVLHLPADSGAVATLTIRIADDRGRPVQGKRVLVKSVGPAVSTDTISQPESPTDEGGITIARVRPGMPAHTARFSAHIVDDNVHIGQVVEIQVLPAQPPSFFDPPFAPYFAGFDVSPMPLKVGQPTTFKTPLINRRAVPVEIRVRVFATVPNIGLGHWPQVGETEFFVLQPGQSREVKVTWTPTTEVGHVCVQAQVWGRELPAKTASGGILSRLIATAHAQTPTGTPNAGGSSELESRQRNLGTVASCGSGGNVCGAISDARSTIAKMVGPHISSAQLWKESLATWKDTLDLQLGKISEAACDSPAIRASVANGRKTLRSLTPGRAVTWPQAIPEARAVAGIDYDLAGLGKQHCAVAAPTSSSGGGSAPGKKPKPPGWEEPWWWWMYEIFETMTDPISPDPFPPGMNPLDPELGPPFIEGLFQFEKRNREMAARDRGDDAEGDRIHRMTMEEYLKEYRIK